MSAKFVQHHWISAGIVEIGSATLDALLLTMGSFAACLVPAVLASQVAPSLWATVSIPAPAALVLLLPGAYRLLSALVNHTLVIVSDDAIVVRHGPLPWPGRRLHRRSVLGLVRDREYRNVRKTPFYNYGFYSHRVEALLSDGSQVLVIGRLSSADRAGAMRTAIERMLAT